MRNGNSRSDVFDVNDMSSYRTYEEWKLCVRYIAKQSFHFCSYRTYEEWKRVSADSAGEYANKVLTVPMRNGNNAKDWERAKKKFCSYRTYEEWKQSSVTRTLHGIVEVLTVPMRNGNLEA